METTNQQHWEACSLVIYLKNAVSFARRALDLVYRDTTMRVASWLLPARAMRLPKYFPLWERRGYHVTPVHYYQPIPDCRTLPETLWAFQVPMHGIDLHLEQQLDLIAQFGSRYSAELDQIPDELKTESPGYQWNNVYFTGADAAIAYSMIRYFRPRKIIEVGSGYSTLLAAQALQRNEIEGQAGEIIAIEPFPNASLNTGFKGLEKLIAGPVQDVALEVFDTLEENDILFVDSSHVVRIGGDVTFLFQQVLPRLKPGVLVHIHDIFLPYEYPREWIFQDRWFFSEQYLLQAFLAFNPTFRVLIGAHYLYRQHFQALEAAFGARVSGEIRHANKAMKITAGSFWMRRAAP